MLHYYTATTEGKEDDVFSFFSERARASSHVTPPALVWSACEARNRRRRRRRRRRRVGEKDEEEEEGKIVREQEKCRHLGTVVTGAAAAAAAGKLDREELEVGEMDMAIAAAEASACCYRWGFLEEEAC